MSQRDSYEPGVPCFVATMQPDPEAATRFYGAVLGWTFQEGDFYVAQLRGKPVAAVTPLPPSVEPKPAAAWITDVAVASADDVAEKARAAGGTVLAEPFEGPAGRMTVIRDPTGGVLAACERTTGAQLVNEFGAWAMSSLSTADPEAAAAFYGAVFGWTTEEFEMGDAKATMFRLPGYVGGEPEQPVSREVVATMMRGEHAGWTVDFWVSDVDEAVRAAEDHGGTTLAGPFDLPIGRNAVLADPAGVPFSVTRIATPG
jgi:predicted enzyme related to lactoylglutathione lyase